MRIISLELESRLRNGGLWPQSWTAWAAIYALALDGLLLTLQLVLQRVRPAAAETLVGWVVFFSGLAIVLLALSGYRWLRAQLLWRLRNRLIVTYVFIGVIPVVLLAAMSLITLYLLAGQFASFAVTSDITTHLRSMEAANRTIAHHLQEHMAAGERLDASLIQRVWPNRGEWSKRQVCAWSGTQAGPWCAGAEGSAMPVPAFVTADFRDVVNDRGKLYLRTVTVVDGAQPLRVVQSEPFDQTFVANIATALGRITVYRSESQGAASRAAESGSSASVFSSGNERQSDRAFSAGTTPLSSGAFDPMLTLKIPLEVVDWKTGEMERVGAVADVETRPSMISGRLFEARGDYAKGIEYILWSIAIVFAIIELLALVIGTRLTRSITSAVGQLYEATKHINRADFAHRIPVRSDDQLATLANSFNSMTTSIEKLVEEQKEKQRLVGELAIAQEVQAQLYPNRITQLDTLEVHGFCLPARTVSGDYYDFLGLESGRLMLAVGDISGKGISAALMMATIHSAVRAYSIEDVPVLREAASAGVSEKASGGAALLLASESRGADVSPATLMALLNHQLYESTPSAKYATLFLGIYDGATRRLTYANGGHLSPILISDDGSTQRLSCSGTIVGMFDNLSFPEARVELRPGDILVAYSDGVTEPENDYGEFGEERLVQLVGENRHLPLERITEIVTAAVHDWIGEGEQPDDVTLVLARAR